MSLANLPAECQPLSGPIVPRLPIVDAGAIVSRAIASRQLENVERKLLQLPQEEVPTDHDFAPGVYLRTVHMAAGLIVMGHEHKTEHLNLVEVGRALVWMDGIVEEIKAPHVFVSKPGVRKVLLILEPCRWRTVHPTHTTDLDELAGELIVKSGAWMEAAVEKLKSCAARRGLTLS